VLHFHLLCAVGLHHRELASSTSKLYCVVEMCSVRPDSKRSRTRLRLGPFPLWDEAFLFPVLVPEMALVQVRWIAGSQPIPSGVRVKAKVGFP
jgi:hypothetical protein